MTPRLTPRLTARLTALVFVMLAPLAACGDDDDAPESEVPNPASVFCEEQGGTVEIERDDDKGERGICVLPDGSRVDEWEYYRENSPDAS